MVLENYGQGNTREDVGIDMIVTLVCSDLSYVSIYGIHTFADSRNMLSVMHRISHSIVARAIPGKM